jgi:hypothetical protein
MPGLRSACTSGTYGRKAATSSRSVMQFSAHAGRPRPAKTFASFADALNVAPTSASTASPSSFVHEPWSQLVCCFFHLQDRHNLMFAHAGVIK